jgi:hypothetical protein
MNREIILRVRSPEGQLRLSVQSRDTFGELLLQVQMFYISAVQKT